MGTDVQTVHGLRAAARTLLAEVLDVDPLVIEAQLAHAGKDTNGRAYKRTQYMQHRAGMMQTWADPRWRTPGHPDPAALVFFSGALQGTCGPLALNTYAEFQGVPETLRMAGRNYGLRGLPYVLQILVPAALPSILSGAEDWLGFCLAHADRR